MKYQRKPITFEPVEAIQWTGNNFDELQAFILTDSHSHFNENLLYHMEIGDYLVKDNEGDFSLYMNGMFEEVFDKIDHIIEEPNK